MLEVYAINYLKTQFGKSHKNHFKNNEDISSIFDTSINDRVIYLGNDVAVGVKPLNFLNYRDKKCYYKLKIKEKCELKLKLEVNYEEDGNFIIDKITGNIDGTEIISRFTYSTPFPPFYSAYEITPCHAENIDANYITGCGLFKHISVEGDIIKLYDFVDCDLITGIWLKDKINKKLFEPEINIDNFLNYRGKLKFNGIPYNTLTSTNFTHYNELIFQIDNIKDIGENKFEIIIHNLSDINIIKEAEEIPLEDDFDFDNHPTLYSYNRKLLKTKESTYEIKGDSVLFEINNKIKISKEGIGEWFKNLYEILLTKLFNNDENKLKNFLYFFNIENNSIVYSQHYQLSHSDEYIKKIFKVSATFVKMIEICINVYKDNIKEIDNTINGYSDPNRLIILKGELVEYLNELKKIYNKLLVNKVGFESIIAAQGELLIYDEDETGIELDTGKCRIIKLKKIKG